jgi:threonylcarbamoyladenosine tRNA methylthiotransferase MtaB
MPQVPAAQIKARAKALRDAVATERSSWLDTLTGSVQKIAVERGGRAGHAENFAYVGLDRPMPEGSIVSAQVMGIKDSMLQAKVIA